MVYKQVFPTTSEAIWNFWKVPWNGSAEWKILARRATDREEIPSVRCGGSTQPPQWTCIKFMVYGCGTARFRPLTLTCTAVIYAARKAASLEASGPVEKLFRVSTSPATSARSRRFFHDPILQTVIDPWILENHIFSFFFLILIRSFDSWWKGRQVSLVNSKDSSRCFEEIFYLVLSVGRINGYRTGEIPYSYSFSIIHIR